MEEIKKVFLISEAARPSANLQKRLFNKLDTSLIDDPDLKSLGKDSPRSSRLKMRTLQLYLYRKGHFDGVAQKLKRSKLKTIKYSKKAGRMMPDGLWGSETVEAIKNLQRKLGFKEPNDPNYVQGMGVVDGIFGNDTVEQFFYKGVEGDPVADAPIRKDSDRAYNRVATNLEDQRQKVLDRSKDVLKAAASKFDAQTAATKRANDGVLPDDLAAKALGKSLGKLKNALAFLKKGDPNNQVASEYEKAFSEYSQASSKHDNNRPSKVAQRKSDAKSAGAQAMAVAQAAGEKAANQKAAADKESADLDNMLANIPDQSGKIRFDADGEIQFPGDEDDKRKKKKDPNKTDAEKDIASILNLEEQRTYDRWRKLAGQKSK